MKEIPISNFGAVRVPKSLTAETIVGQMNLRMKTRTKLEQKHHLMVK
jgi:hypothetical protein